MIKTSCLFPGTGGYRLRAGRGNVLSVSRYGVFGGIMRRSRPDRAGSGKCVFRFFDQEVTVSVAGEEVTDRLPIFTMQRYL